MPKSETLGTLEPGKQADLLILDGSPLDDIRIRQDRSRLLALHKAGEPVRLQRTGYNPKQDTEGHVLGAIGASGDTSDNDERCALLAIESHGLLADTGDHQP